MRNRKSFNTLPFFKTALLVAGLLLLGIGCANRGEQLPLEETAVTATPAAATAETAVATPVRGTTILADGRLVAVQPKVEVSFVVNGRLLSLHVSPGDNVAEGDVIAQLDDANLQESVVEAKLAVTQAETDLAQAQLSLDNLVNWEPDAAAVSLAEANLTAAQADLESANTQDSVAGNSITSARIRLEQAQRGVADAQAAYDTAFDPGREWEVHYNEHTCNFGEGGAIPCTGPTFSKLMEQEREGVTRGLQGAKDNLAVAQADYNLALAQVNNNRGLAAEAAVANAQQSLTVATTGPKASEIEAAKLTLSKAELAVEQTKLNLAKAEKAVADAQLTAPIAGTVLAVNVAPGALINAGVPVVVVQNTAVLQFQTSNLSERDLAQVTPGQTVALTLKTFPNDPLTGTVARIVPEASGTVGDAATFTAVIDLNPTDLTLLPGMTGRVEIRR